MRLPTPSTDLPLKPTLRPFLRSSTPSTSRSERFLRTEGSAGTPVGSTSAQLWATTSSGSNPSVPLCGRSTSDPLPSGGLTKNSSSFATPTVTQDVTQSVNHQLAPLCQRSGALFRAAVRRSARTFRCGWCERNRVPGGSRRRGRRPQRGGAHDVGRGRLRDHPGLRCRLPPVTLPQPQRPHP